MTRDRTVSLIRDGVLDAWHVTLHHLQGNRTHHYMILVDGKRVELPKIIAEGLHGPRNPSVAPGKEVDLYDWTISLQPKGEKSKNVFTIHGTGKFSLQCEHIVGPTSANPQHPNLPFDKLATGKLESSARRRTTG